MAKKHDERLRVKINAHKLEGWKDRKGWHFTCKSWPDLAAKYEGWESFAEALGEFTRLALEDCTVIEK
jgi:hypothetical protein